MVKVGIGYDTHAFAENCKLILGGVNIPHSKGLAGHSDADVLTHAIIDAILGAAGLPNIGDFFPDTDDRWKGVGSFFLLKEILKHISKSHRVVNVDSVIICQAPKLKSHLPEMKKNLVNIIEAPVNVKATTTEKMNAEGQGKCISAQAISLIECL